MATWQFHVPKEIARLGPNYEILSRRHKSGIAEGIEKAPKVAPGTPCICIGSGPTADFAFPLLKDWKGGIICSTSQAVTLRKWGVEPDYIVALDGDSAPDELGPDWLWKGTKTALVAQPGLMTETVKYWRWKSYWFRKFEPVADEPRIFYQMVQPLVFCDPFKEVTGEAKWDPRNNKPTTWMPVQFVMLASVAPALTFVAKFLGYSPVFLVGIDFGWRDHAHSRFQSWSPKGKDWVANPIPMSGMVSSIHDEAKMMRADNGSYTNGVQIFYKRNFLLGIRLDKWPIYDCGQGGPMDELPYADIRDVVKNQGKVEPFDEVALTKKLDAYLAKSHTYVVEWNGGVNFIESGDFIKEFPIAFGQVKRQGSKDCDLIKNMRRICEASGIECTPEKEAEWLAIMERVATTPPLERMVEVMDSRLAKIDKRVDELIAHPSLGVVSDIKHGIKELKAILAGEKDERKSDDSKGSAGNNP